MREWGVRKTDLNLGRGLFTLTLALAYSTLFLSSTSFAASPTPVRPSASPHKHVLSQEQKSAITAAAATHQAAIQGALDGANKAVADARSIRDQAIAMAPKDKNVKALANSEFKKSSDQIWSAFKSNTTAAKAAYETAVIAIKAGK